MADSIANAPAISNKIGISTEDEKNDEPSEAPDGNACVGHHMARAGTWQ